MSAGSAGAETQALMMSVFRTLEMRGIDPFDWLERGIRDRLAHGTPSPCPRRKPRKSPPDLFSAIIMRVG